LPRSRSCQDTRNAAQPLHVILIRFYPPLDLLLHLVHPRLCESQVPHQRLQQEAVVFGHATFEGQPEFGFLVS
jgi:hypothetical protein